MKNLIAELLVKLAEKDEASDEQTARLYALELVVTSLLCRMNSAELNSLASGVEEDIARAASKTDNPELLQQHVQRLLQAKL
ncbi:anti-adapter protein IraP [Enterobacteriaceae bacterium 4M9]|nr:anti-adapter protein IraP [Enterobacteriaceae bacterium 4M9]